jgi:hypothetical protein
MAYPASFLSPKRKEKQMKDTRNTPVFKQVVLALGYSMAVREIALARLEEFFQDDCLVIVGNVESVEAAVAKLRLNIREEECGKILDHIACQKAVSITVDHVEAAAYELFGNRFIEPEK